jgi:MFS family permease
MSSLQIFLCSRFLTTIAYQIEALAVGWQVYALRKNPLDLGWVGLAQFVPMLAFSLLGGQVADRFERKKILSVAYITWMATVLGMAITTALGTVNLTLFLVLLFVQGTIRAFSNPAAHAYVTQVVPENELKKGVALSATVWQISTISGPLLGGLMYGFFGGATWVYGFCAVFSLLGVILLSRVQSTSHEKTQDKLSLASLFSGVDYVRKNKMILGCISLDLFAVLFGGATALLPAYASDILHTGPTGLGVLRAAPAFGAILTSLILAKRPIKTKVGYWLFVHVTLFGLATIGFGISKWIGLSFLMLFITGASDMVSVVIRMTLVQAATPASMRGRVSAVNSIFISASNELGEFESGVTASWLGVIPSVVLGGIGSIVVAALWAWKFPELRKMEE